MPINFRVTGLSRTDGQVITARAAQTFGADWEVPPPTIPVTGTVANRPTPAYIGQQYLAVDVNGGTLFQSLDGANWTIVGAPAGAVLAPQQPRPWDPSQQGGLLAWYDATDINAGGPQAPTGTAIGTWRDKSGAGSAAGNLVQGTGANQPTPQLDPVTNKVGVVFTGGTQFMDSGTYTQPAPHVEFYAFRFTGTTLRTVRDCNGSENVFISQSAVYGYFAGTLRLLSGAGSAVDTLPHVVAIQYDGAQSQFWLDGFQLDTFNIGSNSAANIRIGANNSGGNGLLGDYMYEYFDVAGRFNAQQMLRAFTYMIAKWTPTRWVMSTFDDNQDTTACPAITSIASTAANFTITFPTPHGVIAGEGYSLSGCSNAAYNGTSWQATSIPSPTTLTTFTILNLGSSTGGQCALFPRLRIYRSADLTRWIDLDGPQYTCTVLSTVPGASMPAVRDPSIMRNPNDGVYYICHTNSGFNTNSFDLIRSAVLKPNSWQFLGRINSPIANTSNVWAPEWFIDPTDGSIHIFVSVSTTGDPQNLLPGLQIYELHPVDPLNLGGAWSNWTLVTGTNFPVNMIDAYVVKIPTGYGMFYKNELTLPAVTNITSTASNFTINFSSSISAAGLQVGGHVDNLNYTPTAYNGSWTIASLTATSVTVTSALNPGTSTIQGQTFLKCIEYATSSSLTSGYTTLAANAGDWQGWGQGAEGPCLVYKGGNSYRIFVDPGNVSYSDTTTGITGTWSALTTPVAIHTGFRHGTIIAQ